MAGADGMGERAADKATDGRTAAGQSANGGSGKDDARDDAKGDARDGARDDAKDGARPDEAVSRFVERFASEMVEAGMPRMPARVFAALLASPDGVLTSAELGEQMQISPAAVSGAVRYLSQVNMVSREREPGSRRDRYRVHSDQWYEALTNRDAILRRWEATLREGVVSLGPDTAPGRRIAETLEFFDFMQRELAGMMTRWREHREKVFGSP